MLIISNLKYQYQEITESERLSSNFIIIPKK